MTACKGKRSARLVCALLFSLPLPVLAETVWIGGSGVASSMAQLLAGAFEQRFPQHKVIVNPPLGAAGGYQALNAGALDIAVTDQAPSAAEDKGRLHVVEFARTPFVLAVAADHPLTDVNMTQLAALYASPGALWPNGARVRLVLRASGHSDSRMIDALAGEVAQAHQAAQARTGMLIAADDHQAARAIARLPGAIGPTTLAQIAAAKLALKGLALGGKRPSVDGIRDGSYPYYQRLFLVTSPLSTPAARQFAEFALSGEGARILAAHACWTGPFQSR